MQRAIRQYIVVSAIALWLGGFTFYALVVVPTGTEVLGGSTEQGFVTQRVTWQLNWIALIALAILLWNLSVEGGPAILVSWLAMLIAQLVLFWMHARLDALLDASTHEIQDDFHFLHEAYLWVASLQWMAGLMHVWCVLSRWRKTTLSDRTRDSAGNTANV